MAIETDTLKTLERIEKLLEKSLLTAKPNETETRKPAIAGKGKAAKKDTTDKSVIKATKNLDRLSSSAEKTAKTLMGARGDLVAFRSGLRSAASATTASLSSLNNTIESVINSMASATLLPDDTRKKTSKDFLALGSSAAFVRIQFGMLARSAHTLTGVFEKAAGVVLGALIPADKELIAATHGVTKEINESSDALNANNKQQSRSSSFFGGILSRFGISLKKTGDTSEWLSGQFKNLGHSLADALVNAIGDIYHLQSQGIAAGDSLFSLYGKAAKAGMSLEDYTSMLQDNSAAVVRARSFDDFSKDIDRTTRQLNKLGVFGPTAEKLAAALKTNTVVLGISQDKQAGAVDSQVKMFENLRKSTMMTADAFKELAADVANNQNVQEDMLGLAPAERAERMNQLIQTATIGQRMGATAQASKQLTDALLEQRKATAEQRFQAAGYIRQAGAMTGMGAAETEELARLRMKKRRSPEEDARFTELSGKLEARLQTMQNSGNIQAEFLSEKMGELIGSTPQGEVQKAAGQVELQKQAGSVQNQDIGKETGAVGQAVGKALTALSGVMKNPLADAGIIFSSILAQSLMQNKWLSIIARNTSGVPGTGAAGGKKGMLGRVGAAATSVKTMGLDMFQKTVDTAKNVGPAAKKGFTSLFTAANTYAAGVGELAKQTKSGALMSVVSDVASLAKSIVGGGLSAAVGGASSLLSNGIKMFAKTGPFAILFGSVEELFTGEMTKALGLGDGFGSRLLGAVAAGLNSFFTGITRLIDGGINWVMEGLGLSFRSNITKLFDLATSYLTDGVKYVLLGIVKVMSSSLEFFGFKDAPWLKSLKETEKGLNDSLEESSANREKLMKTEGATLRSIGAEQIKTQQETADKSKKLVQATKDNVVAGIDALAASAQRTVDAVQSVQATPNSNASIIATPAETKQSSVSPPDVNKTSAAESPVAEKTTETSETTARGEDEVVLVLKQQVQLLQQMLTFWTNQEGLGETLLKAANRPALTSSEKMFGLALGRNT